MYERQQVIIVNDESTLVVNVMSKREIEVAE